jgi:hypothetical protein
MTLSVRYNQGKFMKNPFEGHPYRGGVSEQERLEMAARDLADNYRRIIKTLKEPDGRNKLKYVDQERGDGYKIYLNYKANHPSDMYYDKLEEWYGLTKPLLSRLDELLTAEEKEYFFKKWFLVY